MLRILHQQLLDLDGAREEDVPEEAAVSRVPQAAAGRGEDAGEPLRSHAQTGPAVPAVHPAHTGECITRGFWKVTNPCDELVKRIVPGKA